MVWFQCEDCGENLKKPKLPNHFRICHASKLSCIDCGEVFGQESVQSHTQCVTEAEKYGPKGQGKAPNATSNKRNNNGKLKPDVDIKVGLSDRPPWFCSLCNTQATSQQTLLLHAEGKKHRAKARAFHAANQKPTQAEESTQDAKFSTEKDKKEELHDNGNVEEPKEQQPTKIGPNFRSLDTENGSLKSSKKRKIEASNYDVSMQTTGGGPSGELGNGEVVQVETEGTNSHCKKSKHSVTKEEKVAPSKDGGKKKIKWKKLITSVLKEAPEGSLKMRKLKKLLMKKLNESGCADDEDQLTTMLEHKINSSSKFSVDGKYVHLVPKC